MAKVSIAYEVKDTVPEDGEYICVPCGKKVKFEKGDKFPACISCKEMKKDNESGSVAAGAELWEKVEDEQ